MVLTMLLVLINPTKGAIRIEKLDTNSGFSMIKQEEINVIERYQKLVHVIDVEQLKETIIRVENNIKESFGGMKDAVYFNQLQISLNGLKHKVQSILPHRQKRGLLNIGGNVLNWVFGVMNNDDREDIEKHLRSVDENNHNAITNLNSQTKINLKMQENLKIITDSVVSSQKLMSKLYNAVTEMDKSILKQLHFMQILTDLRILGDEVEKVQDNIMSAKQGTMSRSFLTDEEIDFYNIDFNKLQQISCHLGYVKNTLFFVLLIPVFSQEEFTQYKLIPVPNNVHEELVLEQTDIIMSKNSVFFKNDENYIKQMKSPNTCIINLMKNNYENCKSKINRQFQTIELELGTILLKNANNVTLENNCNFMKYQLYGNVLITFNNCTVNISNVQYANNVKEIKQRIIVPNYNEIKNVNKEIELHEIHLSQIENTKEIKEIKFLSKKQEIVIFSSLSFTTILLLTILVLIFCRRNRINVKVTNKNLKSSDVQENVKPNEGGVTYPATLTSYM